MLTSTWVVIFDVFDDYTARIRGQFRLRGVGTV